MAGRAGRPKYDKNGEFTPPRQVSPAVPRPLEAICLKAIENAASAASGEVPTRAAVATAVRALKDFKGITGTFTFNSIGDPITAQYFVIQVNSPDPAKWSSNTITETLNIAPPAP